MKTSDKLQIFSQILSFTIFLYFSIILIQTNPFDIISLSISAIGLFGSLILSIISTIERLKEN